jgi:excinuclease ABC subunit B
MYANTETGSMKRAIHETNRRRTLQEAYNTAHNITPSSIIKNIEKGLRPDIPDSEKPKLDLRKVPKDEYTHLIRDLTAQMEMASANLQFERAAELRDFITEIKAKL